MATKRRRPPKAVRQAQPSPKPDSPPEPPRGATGDVFTNPRHTRSDGRLAARMISLGVVPEETAQALLEAGLSLAARIYAACMLVAIEVAKLEKDPATQQVNQQINLQVNQQVVLQQAVARMTDEQLRALAALDAELEEQPGE